MLIVHDPRCAEYGSSARPEQPARITRSAAYLRQTHPAWEWRLPDKLASPDTLLLAHTSAHLERLAVAEDFDDDTPFLPGIAAHARASVDAALIAARHALTTRSPAFSLMRPPGHHATAERAMGFCYLNQIAVAALAAQTQFGAARVAVWDFDAHHGNGTEAILHAQAEEGNDGLFFASVHQFPAYPGTGARDLGPQVRNWPVAPHIRGGRHLEALRESFDAVLKFDPDLILVSAGFDAYRSDPLMEMTLETNDFATLGSWLYEAGRPTAALLEGGYSPDLPLLIDAFLQAWENGPKPA